MKNILAIILLLMLTGPAQPPQAKPAAQAKPAPEVVQATREQTLEYALALAQIEASRNRALALRAEAQLADQVADRLSEGLPKLLEGFIKAAGLEPAAYEAQIDKAKGRIFFTLKKGKAPGQ